MWHSSRTTAFGRNAEPPTSTKKTFFIRDASCWVFQKTRQKDMDKKDFNWLKSQLSSWETPLNTWGEVNVYSDYRDERPAKKPRIHLEDAPGRNPFYIPLSPYDGIDRLTAYSGNYGENYAAAQKRQDHHTRFRLGGQQKRRLSLRNTGEESSYGDGPLYQPYPQGTNLLGYDTNGLPLELTVTAPRKYVAKYNDMGNPIYTTDRNLSMGYITLPQIVEQMARKNALTEMKNRRAGKLTGTAKVMSDVAVGGIGSTLLPLVGQPIVQSTWPTIKDILPSLAKAEIGARSMDLATRTFTPYENWSDGMGQLVQTATGWNPNASTLGRMATDMTNPGYWNLYGASDRIINAVGSKVVYPAEEAVKTVVDNGTLYDPYTTFRGRFGNYGDNILTDIYGTVARRFGLPDKARIPADAMRKISEPVRIENGMVDLTGGRYTNGTYHTNATIDRPVVSHENWIGDGADTYLFPMNKLVNGQQGSLISIEPSDVFYHGSKVTAKPNEVTLISGDIDILKMARQSGMQTLSSPKLRRMYSERVSKYQQEQETFNYQPSLKSFASKQPIHPKEVRSHRWDHAWPEYAAEIQRLQSMRGTPTLGDFRLLEELTGLKAGVAPLTEYEKAIRQFSAPIIQSNGEIAPLIYPNGREVDIFSTDNKKNEWDLLQRAKYNNVFYDPASMVESNWKKINGFE